MALLGTITSTDQVRALFGLGSDELADVTILARATRVDLAVRQNIPDYLDVIDAELTDPVSYAVLVDYVANVTAAFLVPTLKTYLEQSTRDDSGAEGSRYNLTDKDLDRLLSQFQNNLQAYTQELVPETDTASFSIFGRSTPIYDVVTGTENE